MHNIKDYKNVPLYQLKQKIPYFTIYLQRSLDTLFEEKLSNLMPSRYEEHELAQRNYFIIVVPDYY